MQAQSVPNGTGASSEAMSTELSESEGESWMRESMNEGISGAMKGPWSVLHSGIVGDPRRATQCSPPPRLLLAGHCGKLLPF